MSAARRILEDVVFGPEGQNTVDFGVQIADLGAEGRSCHRKLQSSAPAGA